MKLFILFLASVLCINAFSQNTSSNANAGPLVINTCNDFGVNGKGDNEEWRKANWNTLTKLDTGGKTDDTKFKMLYSATGVYVLFHGDDSRITTSYVNDFDYLFKGDVFEVFFQPDTATTMYLEYEVNHLNKELVLLVPNFNGKAFGWQPFSYSKNRKVQKAVVIEGGKSEMGATITGWSAELFFPYALFNPLQNVPPKKGSTWHANFYRLDYDSGKMIKWGWSPIDHTFHEYKKFGTIVFK